MLEGVSGRRTRCLPERVPYKLNLISIYTAYTVKNMKNQKMGQPKVCPLASRTDLLSDTFFPSYSLPEYLPFGQHLKNNKRHVEVAHSLSKPLGPRLLPAYFEDLLAQKLAVLCLWIFFGYKTSPMNFPEVMRYYKVVKYFLTKKFTSIWLT